jgi:hypothetical protein
MSAFYTVKYILDQKTFHFFRNFYFLKKNEIRLYVLKSKV